MGHANSETHQCVCIILVDHDVLKDVVSYNPVACLEEDHLDALQYEPLCEIGGVGASSEGAFVYSQPQHELGSTRHLTVH